MYLALANHNGIPANLYLFAQKHNVTLTNLAPASCKSQWNSSKPQCNSSLFLQITMELQQIWIPSSCKSQCSSHKSGPASCKSQWNSSKASCKSQCNSSTFGFLSSKSQWNSSTTLISNSTQSTTYVISHMVL